MQDNHSDLLERLKHPEEEEARRQKVQNNLFLRNILNLLFILLALVTMAGIGYFFFSGKDTPMWCYYLGIVAVIVKMCESMIRMPWLHKSNGIPTHRRRR